MLTDVVVVGGGIIGLTSALRLQSEGFQVTVVERDEPAHGTSAGAGGVLAPLLDRPKPPPLVGLGISSLVRWRAVLDEWELKPLVAWREGVVVAAETRQHLADLEALLPEARSADPQVERLDRLSIHHLVPGLGAQVEGGLYYPSFARVDAGLLVRLLYQRAREKGVRFRSGVLALSIETRSGHVRGVRIAGEVVPGGAVVLAAGAWTGQILALAGEVLPVYPVRGTYVILEGALVPPFPVFGRGRHIIPRPDGRLLIGGVEEQAGFAPGASLAAVRRLSETHDLYPPMAGGRVAELWSGWRPATPDSLPVLGWWPGVEGLFVASGHFRNGILLAPITADVVATALLQADLPLDLTPFAPGRFRLDDWPVWLHD
jgi:glycine oxidase